MGSGFEVDVRALQTLAFDLGDASGVLGKAQGELAGSAQGQTGDPSLDKACNDFQSKWGYGIGQLAKTTQAFADGLKATVQAYQSAEDEITKLFGGQPGGTTTYQPGPVHLGPTKPGPTPMPPPRITPEPTPGPLPGPGPEPEPGPGPEPRPPWGYGAPPINTEPTPGPPGGYFGPIERDPVFLPPIHQPTLQPDPPVIQPPRIVDPRENPYSGPIYPGQYEPMETE
ncbi:hypothetical protein ABH940_000844 [Streptacidiphilus sp. BW17]|uniref:WXG100 family type VII secretion target n=1 Tax=Streptacidiphilus sp. BW17 TaxID=3156274 RepID=UPI003511557D